MKTALIWTLAIVITLGSVVFQRLTGPSYPVRVKHVLSNGETISFRLPTSHVTELDAPVVIPASTGMVAGEIAWRRLNSRDDWATVQLERSGDTLKALLPRQPAAGKISYSLILVNSAGDKITLPDKPVVLRFKGHVPIGVLAPHIAFMFFSMLLATRTGIEAIARRGKSQGLAFWTATLLLVGGLILGPIVQKFAFGAYWTGWPFGHDLTDNKTALAMLVWIIAIWRGRKTKGARWWYVSAASVHLLVYLIPHSMFGSELDYTAEN